METYIIIILIVFITIIVLLFVHLIYTFPGLFFSNDHNYDIDNISHIIGEYDIFDNNQLDEIKCAVDTMVSENNHQTTNSVMNVIGYPTYIYPANITNSDLYDSGSNYCINRNVHNNVLLDNVSFIYPIILDKLKYITNSKCEYPVYNKKIYKNTKYTSDYLYSLPGFHIFKGGSWLGSGWEVASLHVDLQFDKLNFDETNYYKFDKTDVFSFTIPISIPENCGLYIYDKTQSDINSVLPLSYSLRGYERYKINYKIGKLYIHDGLHFHMISAFDSNVNDNRITIQGHGIFCETTGSYWIYW